MPPALGKSGIAHDVARRHLAACSSSYPLPKQALHKQPAATLCALLVVRVPLISPLLLLQQAAPPQQASEAATTISAEAGWPPGQKQPPVGLQSLRDQAGASFIEQGTLSSPQQQGASSSDWHDASEAVPLDGASPSSSLGFVDPASVAAAAALDRASDASSDASRDDQEQPGAPLQAPAKEEVSCRTGGRVFSTSALRSGQPLRKLWRLQAGAGLRSATSDFVPVPD